MDHLIKQSQQLELQVKEMAAWLAAGEPNTIEQKRKLWTEGFGKVYPQLAGNKRKAQDEHVRGESPVKRAKPEGVDAVEEDDITAEVQARLKARRKKPEGKRRRSSGFSDRGGKRRRKLDD